LDKSKFDEKPICVLVGPEGDFSEEEREKILKYKRVLSIKINDNILRSETAVISSLSIVNYAIS
jgi:16S rRNA (uracil1498-N3)-methyltransferase